MTDDFNPRDHFRELRGRGGAQDYLDVKWRLVWFRREHPDGLILTQHVKLEPDQAIFKATITNTNGGMASGYGSETPGDFSDYIEKAETKAIGRALNALGYGASSAPDDDQPETGATSANQHGRQPAQPTRPVSPPAQSGNGAPVTPHAASVPVLNAHDVLKAALERGLTKDDITRLRERFYPQAEATSQLTQPQLQEVIDRLDELAQERFGQEKPDPAATISAGQIAFLYQTAAKRMAWTRGDLDVFVATTYKGRLVSQLTEAEFVELRNEIGKVAAERNDPKLGQTA